MKTHPNMSDDEWKKFLAAIPEAKKIPPEDRGAFLRKEGITESDLHWWNNMSDQEREFVKKELQAQNLGLLIHFHKRMGMSAHDALIKMHKTNAIYDDYPLSAQHIAELEKNGLHEKDYPLPWELSDRIGRFMASIQQNNNALHHKVQALMQGSTSANAAIRTLIHYKIM